jgi:hypothetical protein
VWNQRSIPRIEVDAEGLMNSTVLHLHGWLEMKCHLFQVGSVLFRFELQQVLLALVFIEAPVPSVVTTVCVYSKNVLQYFISSTYDYCVKCY